MISIKPSYCGWRRVRSWRAPRLLEDIPGRRELDEPSPDDHVAKDVDRVEMRVAPPPEEHLQEVPAPVREEVNAWVAAAQPPGEEEDG